MKALTTSIIMPVRNGARFIRASLCSVMVEMVSGDEIIVVDDGSTDETAVIVANEFPQARLIANNGRGLSAARNTGLAASSGDLIAFLDSDDLWPPGRQSELRRLLQERPEATSAFGRCRNLIETVVAPGRVLPREDIAVPQLIFSGLYRHAIVRAAGGFDESLTTAEDGDFHFRLVDAGQVPVLTDAVTLIYRAHDANMSADLTREAVDLFVLEGLRRLIARRKRIRTSAPRFGTGEPVK
jgi:glycosyltransferase involved in cell wall biosynthesis